MESVRGSVTSIDKALEVCEVLSGMPRGMSLSDLARALRQPASTVHRLLAVLKKRGYVRQDDETSVTADAQDARPQLPLAGTIRASLARIPDHARVRASHAYRGFTPSRRAAK
jgi:DNA-binding IclR family transcriptional regulator